MNNAVTEEQLAIEAEAARRIADAKSDRKFMNGVYQAMKDSTAPVPWKNLKRK